jgi:hypothetical protein
MLTFGVVVQLDVFEYFLAGLLPAGIGVAVDEFSFQGFEE